MNPAQRRTSTSDNEDETESCSDSTCSSCCQFSDASVPEWDGLVQENGELCFMKCSPITQDFHPNHHDETRSRQVVRSKSNKFSTFLRKPRLRKKNKDNSRIEKLENSSSFQKVNDDCKDVANGLDDHSEHSIAVLYLNVASIETSESDTFYYFPQPGDKNMTYLIRGALLTLHHLLPKLMSEKIESCTLCLKEEIVQIIFIAGEKGLMLLACPENRCSPFQLKQLGRGVKHYLRFKFKSLDEAFSNSNHHTSLDQFFGNLFIKLLSNKFNTSILDMNDSYSKGRGANTRFEEAFICPRSLSISYDLESDIHEKLNELEANDFGDLSEDHYGCQRLFLITGTCLYFKGYLIVNHLHTDDLIDVHSYLRLNDILDLTVTSVMESLVVWQEVYLSSYNRDDIQSTLSSNKRWFLLIVGKGHGSLVALLESGGCSVSSTEVLRPDELYVEQVQDTLNDILRLGLSEEIRRFVKSPSSNSARSTRRSSCRSADSSRLNLSQSSNGVCDETFSESVSRTNSSAISDEVLPVMGRRAQRLQQLSNSGSIYTLSQSNFSDSDASDCDTTGSSYGGSSFGSKHFSTSTTSKRIIHGDEKALFHYVNLRIDRGEVLYSMKISDDDDDSGWVSPSMKNNFELSAVKIHAALKQSSVRAESQRNSLAVKEYGILYEDNSAEDDVEKRISTPTFYWIVGRSLNKSNLGETYVCYDDKTPQNMVEVAFRLAMNS